MKINLGRWNSAATNMQFNAYKMKKGKSVDVRVFDLLFYVENSQGHRYHQNASIRYRYPPKELLGPSQRKGKRLLVHFFFILIVFIFIFAFIY